jgi:hypothetical protein
VRIRKECFLTTLTHQISHQLTFFLFPEVKQHLANVTLTLDTFRSSWERAIRTITTDEFAAAYRR